MSIAKIKKGDQVKVIAGQFRGSEGQILDVITNKKNPNKVQMYFVVSGIKQITKYKKANIQFNIPGEKLSISRKIHSSNIQLLVDNTVSRVKRVKADDSDKKFVRIYTKNNKPVPEPEFVKRTKGIKNEDLKTINSNS